MSLLQIVYPFALAGANLLFGWLFYHLSNPVFGGLLVVTGLFVILAVVGSTLRQHRPMFRRST